MSAENGFLCPEHDVASLLDENDPALEVQGRWAGMSMDDVLARMPEMQTYTRPSGNQIRYGDLVPTGDYDEEHVLSLRLPIANGLRPHMLIRAVLMQDMLDVPQVVRVFPNDTRGEKTLSINDDEMEDIKTGNFLPIAQLQQASIEHDFGNRTVVDVSGYSLGGAIGLNHALIAPTRSVDVSELPNIALRTPGQLNKAATNGSLSLSPINKAILDTGIPVLAEAFGVKHRRTSVKQFLVGGVSFALDTLLANNRAMQIGLGHPTAIDDLILLADVQPDVSLVIARAENSKIMPKEAGDALTTEAIGKFRSFGRYVMSGYAHEAGDNIFNLALLSRQARRNAAYSRNLLVGVGWLAFLKASLATFHTLGSLKWTLRQYHHSAPQRSTCFMPEARPYSKRFFNRSAFIDLFCSSMVDVARLMPSGIQGSACNSWIIRSLPVSNRPAPA